MSAPEGEVWNNDLHRTKGGQAMDILHNAVVILRKDGRFKGRLRWSEMTAAAEGRDLPWRKGDEWRQWSEGDDLQLANWCQERGAYVKERTCAAAVQLVAADQRVHPVRDRLRSLEWDGKERLSRWLFTYLGVQTGRR